MQDSTAVSSCCKPRLAAWGVALVWLVLLAVVLALPGATADATAPAVAPQRVLSVAVSADYWPMESLSGSDIVGHDIDLMNAVAAALGMGVTYTNVPWEGLFQALAAGQYDLIVSTVSVTPDREEIADFSLPYVVFFGSDQIAIVVQQGDAALRQALNEALVQLRADGTLGTIVAQIASDVPEWYPALPNWPTAPAGIDSTLVFTDTATSAPMLEVPAGAVQETTLIAYTPVETITTAIPAGLAVASQAFALEAYQGGAFVPTLTFGVPVTMTVTYCPVAVAGMDPDTLRLGRRDAATGVWADAASTCAPGSVYVRRRAQNQIAVAICRPGEFVLLGEYRVGLPCILRR